MPASRKTRKTAPAPKGAGAVSRSTPNASDIVAKHLPGKRVAVGQRLALRVGEETVVGVVVASGVRTFTLRPDGARGKHQSLGANAGTITTRPLPAELAARLNEAARKTNNARVPADTLNGFALGPQSPMRDVAASKAPRAKRKNAEHAEQAMLMQWLLTLPESRYPGARWAFAVPNAARRGPALAAMMKREGLRKGAPDVVVPSPLTSDSWELGPLWVEMKDPANYGLAKGEPTPEQKDYHRALAALGYHVAVCYGFDAGRRAVEAHYRERFRPNEFHDAGVRTVAGARYFSPNPLERKRDA